MFVGSLLVGNYSLVIGEKEDNFEYCEGFEFLFLSVNMFLEEDGSIIVVIWLGVVYCMNGDLVEFFDVYEEG